VGYLAKYAICAIACATAWGQAQAQVRDTLPPAPRPAAPGQLGGQSMNPDISAIGELLTDFSPKRPKTTSEGERFEVREVELGLQAVVDPFFRADFFIGMHPDAVEVEEAYLTALDVRGFQFKLGKFHLPLGKVNLIHRPEQITIDYPWMIREFFGDEGLASSGIGVSRIFAPLGFFQELLVYGVTGISSEGHAHAHGAEEAPEGPVLDAEDELKNQFAVLAQLRNFIDLSTAANLEFGASAAFGRAREFDLLDCGPAGQSPCQIGDSPVRQERFEPLRFYGGHLTVRWRPLQQGLYRSLIWNNEILIQDAPEGSRLGGFSQAQYQVGRRTYLGARFDAVEEESGEEWRKAASGYFTVFPSEFSRFKVALEREFGAAPEWRAVMQTTFAIGPHRPHAF
jgi:hypothetical protein